MDIILGKLITYTINIQIQPDQTKSLQQEKQEMVWQGKRQENAHVFSILSTKS